MSASAVTNGFAPELHLTICLKAIDTFRYNRQLRKVTKTKGAFPSDEAARKLLFLVNRNITRKWTAPVPNWARIRNQLAIRFMGRLPM